MTDPVTDPKLEAKKLDFVAILTLVLLLSFFIVAGLAIWKNQINFKDLLTYTLPQVTMFAGYWVRGASLGGNAQ